MASTDCSHGLLNHPSGNTVANSCTIGSPALASVVNRKLKISQVTKSGPTMMMPARMLRCRLRNGWDRTDFTRCSYATRIREPFVDARAAALPAAWPCKLKRYRAGTKRKVAGRSLTAKPESLYPKTAALESTRPPGTRPPTTGPRRWGGASGDPAQGSTGHTNSGFALKSVL